MRKKKENTKELVDSRLAALGFALLLRHLFVDRINLSLGVTVFVSERAPAADATLTARGPLLLCRRPSN